MIQFFEFNLCSPKSAPQQSNAINGDPMFVDAGKGLFWLRAGTAARGKGSAKHTPGKDFWGEPYESARIPDVGALPFVPALAQPQARERFTFGWSYYRHGSGGTIPDFWQE